MFITRDNDTSADESNACIGRGDGYNSNTSLVSAFSPLTVDNYLNARVTASPYLSLTLPHTCLPTHALHTPCVGVYQTTAAKSHLTP